VPETNTSGVVNVQSDGRIYIPKELRGNVAEPKHVTFVRRRGENKIECYLEGETVKLVDGDKSATSNLTATSGQWTTSNTIILRTLGMSDGSESESTQLTVRLADAGDEEESIFLARPLVLAPAEPARSKKRPVRH